jgi:hypothetical protein
MIRPNAFPWISALSSQSQSFSASPDWFLIQVILAINSTDCLEIENAIGPSDV